nr:immunoglobulin heavy chain junction region [Macaca mulatta]
CAAAHSGRWINWSFEVW